MTDIDTTGSAADAPASAGADAAGGTPTPVPAAPTAIDLADDTLVRVKGSDKPVKFSDHVRGFQSQFTKASQRAAQLERELQAERAARHQYEQQQQRAGQANSPDVFAQLRQLPYLTGNDAVEVVQSIGEQIRQRDYVLLAALKQMQQLQQLVGGLNETHTMSNFDAKINRWLTDGGYPAEAADLAKEIYLAYEGDDLDEDFPRIFSERWNQVEKLVEARRAAKVASARRVPFVPGKGGATGPSNPVKLDPRASSRQIADELWDAMQSGAET